MFKRFICFSFLFTAFALQAATIHSQAIVNVISTPDTHATIVATVSPGDNVVVQNAEANNGFIFIKTTKGKEGWIPMSKIAEEKPVETNLAMAENKAQEGIAQTKKTVQAMIQQAPEITAEATAHIQNQVKNSYEAILVNGKEARRWFLAGALVFTVGIIIGLIIGKLTWRERKSKYRLR